ncbi:hypothetical protein [Nitrospira sp. BLG_1]|uniref:hypothetical protein n=1 Tax=Nitrospira sp. BLG_1 TaxID=3395883 RepID=UPI0039BC5E36
MSEISFSGPLQVTPELIMAMWRSMPEMGRVGTAQLFFAHYAMPQLPDDVLAAGARIFFEKSKIPEAAASALREGVAEKCKEIASKQINLEKVNHIIEDEVRKATAEYAKNQVPSLLSAIPIELLLKVASPIIAEVVKSCAHYYLTRSQSGQDFMLNLVQKVCEEEAETTMREVVRKEVFVATETPLKNATRASVASFVLTNDGSES